jgi:vacuolar iron transporter family protein
MSPERVPPWQLSYHARVDPHRPASPIAQVILGAQDGIVNVLGVLLGVSAASGSRRLVLAAALAAAVAESLSMGAVAYTSSVAENDVYRAERDREYRHVRDVPAVERDEIRLIYERKGFRGELLDRIVSTITTDPDVWVAVMMSEEHGLRPTPQRRSIRSALVVLLASLVGSLLPVFPYLAISSAMAPWAATGLAAALLFAMGAYKARTTVGPPLRAGLELAAIGMASAMAGWGIGEIFQRVVSS